MTYCGECEDPIHYEVEAQGPTLIIYEVCSCGRKIVGKIKLEEDRAIAAFEGFVMAYKIENKYGRRLLPSVCCTMFPDRCRVCPVKMTCPFAHLSCRWGEVREVDAP